MRNKKFSFPVNPLVGSNSLNIISLWRKHKIELAYYPKFILTFLIAVIFEIFNLWERIAIRNRLKVQHFEEPPVFIIGFWRSGTTLLHNLLCNDPKTSYTTTFQVVFPHVTISQAWWLKKLTNLLLPADRPFDNVSMDMDFPQEEEYGLAAMQPFSLYNLFTFPADFDQILKEEFYTGKFNDEQLKIWQKKYKKLISVAMMNTGGTRYMSKNPCNLGRIQLLLSMYPEAKFIFIYRDPYRVAESLYQFILAVFPGTQLQKIPSDYTREKIVMMYAEIMNQYFISKPAIPQNQLIELKMEDFVKDKFTYLKKVYDDLNLTGYENAKPYFEDYLQRNSNYAREPYEIPEEIYHLMNRYASDIIKRLGYEIKEV